MENYDADDRRWHLAAKVLTDRLDHREELEWEELLRDSKFRKDFEFLKKHWDNFDTLPYLQISKEEGWDSLGRKIATFKKKRTSLPTIWRYAAAILFCISVSLFIGRFFFKGEPQIATTIEAPNGGSTFVTLPDSSSVWLNAGSRISFAQSFGKKDRDIRLEGEAFFDVEKDEVPFKIHTNDFDVVVLGTAFNVSAYSADDLVSTTLIRGSLKVVRTRENGSVEQFLLNPNEKIILKGNPRERTGQPMVLLKKVDGLAESDWKEGWLTVRGESLGELSRKIERIYNVTIVFSDAGLKNYRYNGRIQQLSLEQALTALALTSPIRYEISEKIVTISENPLTKSKYKTLP